MGWNAGYTIIEQQVVAAYDSGALTPALLTAMLDPLRGRDVDHGGCRNLRTKDGLSADEVIISLLCTPAAVVEIARLKAEAPRTEQLNSLDVSSDAYQDALTRQYAYLDAEGTALRDVTNWC